MIRYCKKCEIATERNTQGACRLCAKRYASAYRKVNRDKLLAYAEAHREERLVAAKFYRWRNREAIKMNAKAYYDANREQILAKAKFARELDAMSLREFERKYLNPDLV